MVIKKVIHYFKNKPLRQILAICVFQMVLHIPNMHLPPVGNHVWRQCNTLAVARNYAEEDMRIWLPRIDKRYYFTGVTGNSFPAYEYSLAVLYKVFGFSHVLHRWLSLLLSCLAIAGMYYLAFSIFNKRKIAFFSALSLLCIPEFYYQSINAVPDILALSAMIWGWLCLRCWLQNSKWRYWLFATVLLLLAGLVKVQFLLIGLPVSMAIFSSKGFLFYAKNWYMALSAGLILSICYVWYQYADYLTYKDWLLEFVHAVRPPKSVGAFFTILSGNVVRDIPETWVGYGLLVPVVGGLMNLWKQKQFWAPALASFLAIIFVYIALQEQFSNHGYYFLSFAPFVALLAGLGADGFKNKKLVWVLSYTVAIVWAIFRIQGNWSADGYRVPETLYNLKNQKQILLNTDTTKRYIVGPDETGCVFFYYLHAKGFPWYNGDEPIERVATFVRQGATGLITNNLSKFQLKYGDSIQTLVRHTLNEYTWCDLRLVESKKGSK